MQYTSCGYALTVWLLLTTCAFRLYPSHHHHTHTQVYYAREAILTTDLKSCVMLWVQAWLCVCVCVCACCSFTWHIGSVSHWCAGSLILSSCCCSSSAPSGRGSWTQSGCTLHRKEQINCVNSTPKIGPRAHATPFGFKVDTPEVWVVLNVGNKEAKRE